MKKLLEYKEVGEESFSDDYTLDLDGDKRDLYFQVKAEKGFNDIVFKKSRFLKMTVEDIDNLDHTSGQIIITIVDRNKI